MGNPDKRFYGKGLRFECTGCGECCRARGSYSYVYVTREDRRRLARHFRMPTRGFTRRHCEKTHGFFHLRNPARDCEFLAGSRCSVYAARPGQCRTFPFWPENLNAKTWNGELRRHCEGIGIGRVHTLEEIEVQLADERRRANRS